ncbi:MAG: hypothetical protein J6B90_03140 [Lachnospiraceae bacterium]|nr:hypothetical protein [Lachnospiraceae bacterium]
MRNYVNFFPLEIQCLKGFAGSIGTIIIHQELAFALRERSGTKTAGQKESVSLRTGVP